ncbi:TIGR03619 family F420-dependent LLM class oxidoreductase [Haladaptatus sp. NG-SE-30]
MMDSMEFGIMLSATSNAYGIPDADLPEVFRRSTRTAEESGFDVVVAGDHIVYPERIPSDYEYSSSGEPPFDTDTSVYDVFQVLAQLAVVTDDIKLGTNVVPAPYRHPLVLTKNVLTIDSLSNGRFDFGVAPGWMETEFEALDVPFEERGPRTDEFLEIFELACENGTASYEGEFYQFDAVGFHPRPAHNIPVWIGGKSGAAIRRVGQFGTGWSTLWDHPDQVADTRNRIMNAWTDFDREGDPEIAVLRPVNLDADANSDRLLSGSPESIIEDIKSYRAAGVTRLIVDFFTTDIDKQVALMTQFGDEVIDAL